eukprot:gene344-biopygen6006
MEDQTFAFLVLFLTAVNAEEKSRIYHDSNGTTHLMSPNPSLPFAVNGIHLFQAMSNIAKCMQLPCPPHHYRTGCEEIMSSGQCTPCRPCSREGQYRLGCGGASEGVCFNVTSCNAGEFEVRAPTPTNDRFCAAPLCSAAEFEISAVTASTNRQCVVMRKCNSTEFENYPPTVTTNRLCEAVTTCAVNQVETHAPTATTDRHCAACSNETDRILDCADVSSRVAITANRICEVVRIDNCCCNEFTSLKRVRGDIILRSDETVLYFGTILEVEGDVRSHHFEWESGGSSLKAVDFGQVRRLMGNMNLRMNQITQIEIGALTRVDGTLDLSNNYITSVDFKAVTHIGGLRLSFNALSSIGFGAITFVDGFLYLLNNDLTNIDFGAIQHIDDSISVTFNKLTSINFGGITFIGDNLQFNDNIITNIDFGAITYIGGSVSLNKNGLTHIDFRGVTDIGGHMWLQNNNLTSINFKSIKTVDGPLRVDHNPLLVTVDCHSLGLCQCFSSYTSQTNCPTKCHFSSWNCA